MRGKGYQEFSDGSSYLRNPLQIMISEMRSREVNMKKLNKPPLLRQWYYCPYCHTKLVIYDNTAKAYGLYIKCRTCKKEVQIKI